MKIIVVESTPGDDLWPHVAELFPRAVVEPTIKGIIRIATLFQILGARRTEHQTPIEVQSSKERLRQMYAAT